MEAKAVPLFEFHPHKAAAPDGWEEVFVCEATHNPENSNKLTQLASGIMARKEEVYYLSVVECLHGVHGSGLGAIYTNKELQMVGDDPGEVFDQVVAGMHAAGFKIESRDMLVKAVASWVSREILEKGKKGKKEASHE
jgi:hypothetical protein